MLKTLAVTIEHGVFFPQHDDGLFGFARRALGFGKLVHEHDERGIALVDHHGQGVSAFLHLLDRQVEYGNLALRPVCAVGKRSNGGFGVSQTVGQIDNGGLAAVQVFTQCQNNGVEPLNLSVFVAHLVQRRTQSSDLLVEAGDDRVLPRQQAVQALDRLAQLLDREVMVADDVVLAGQFDRHAVEFST